MLPSWVGSDICSRRCIVFLVPIALDWHIANKSSLSPFCTTREICSSAIGIMSEWGLETGLLLCEVEGRGELMGENGWGLIVAEASSFGSALRGLMGGELVFAVILHSVQRSFSKTRSRSMAIVIPSLAKLNQDVHVLLVCQPQHCATSY